MRKSFLYNKEEMVSACLSTNGRDQSSEASVWVCFNMFWKYFWLSTCLLTNTACFTSHKTPVAEPSSAVHPLLVMFQRQAAHPWWGVTGKLEALFTPCFWGVLHQNLPKREVVWDWKTAFVSRSTSTTASGFYRKWATTSRPNVLCLILPGSVVSDRMIHLWITHHHCTELMQLLNWKTPSPSHISSALGEAVCPKAMLN